MEKKRSIPVAQQGAVGDDVSLQGSPQAFCTLLAGLQEEYWAVCRDRQKLEAESRELRLRLDKSCRSGHCKCGTLNGEIAETAVADVMLEIPEEETVASVGKETEEEEEEKEEQEQEQEEDENEEDEEVDEETESAGSPVLAERHSEEYRCLAQAPQYKRQRSPTERIQGIERAAPREPSEGRLSEHGMGGSELFPDWWNPGALRDHSHDKMHLSALLSVHQEKHSRCMISPVSRIRLFWDLAAALILLYETWSAPFRLIYLAEDIKLPMTEAVDTVILGFFTLDIVLNCNTGVLERGKVTLDRSRSIHQYLRGWFWVDFFATFPFDLMLVGSGGVTSLLRIFRFAKLFKTLRYLRLLKAKRALQSSADGMALLSGLRGLTMPCIILLSLLFLVHVYTCIWSALRHDHPIADDYYDGVHLYLTAFRDVYGALYAFRRLDLRTPQETIFDMAVAVHRIFFVVCFASWVIFTTLVNFENTARMRARTDHALTYLRRHKVPSATQVQVLYGLYESGDAKEMQKDFTYLMESNLPTELQRTILFQLWTPKLLSLGLIRIASTWHVQFAEELALMCFEEVFASSSNLFKEGDVGFSAYLVLSGEVHVVSEARMLNIHDYKPGMWLGENALVNPTFRRGFSAITMSLVSVMTVNAEGFWKLLEKLEIDRTFEDWCTRELWRGLCGRCGSVGDHFAHECTAHTHKMNMHASLSFGVQGSGHRAAREVKDYLKKHNMESLYPVLEELGVNDLRSLQELDLETLRDHSVNHSFSRPFSEMESVLRPGRIETFRQSRQMSMKALLETQNKEHHIFISHYKLEAGTEAALMRSELQRALQDEQEGRTLSAPVFLDSDNLTTLKDVQDRVKKSSNVVVLLTTGVLTRPWVLVEMVTACHLDIHVQLVEVVKPGNAFTYPDQEYYQKLRAGQIMDSDCMAVLSDCSIDIVEVEDCLREIFKSIAVPYSPHRPDKIRQAEIKALLERCQLEVEPQVPRNWARKLRKATTTFALLDN